MQLNRLVALGFPHRAATMDKAHAWILDRYGVRPIVMPSKTGNSFLSIAKRVSDPMPRLTSAEGHSTRYGAYQGALKKACDIVEQDLRMGRKRPPL